MENKDFLLSRIKIKGLFGDKDIDWKLFQDVNILGGVNGSGKSTILKCINNFLFNDEFYYSLFDLIDFIELEFVNKIKIVYSKNDADYSSMRIVHKDKLVFGRHNNIEDVRYYYVVCENCNNISLDEIKSNINVLFINTFENSLIEEDVSEIIDNGYIRTNLDLLIYNQIVKRNELILNSTDYLEEKSIIEEDLIDKFMNEYMYDMASILSKDLERKKNTTTSKNAGIYLEKTKDFFTKKMLGLIAEKRNEIILETRGIFSIYQYLDEFYSETNKIAKRKAGSFLFNLNGKEIDCYHLSTGEKQLLLIFLIVFNTKGEPCILLMDEPDLGLHVTWKEKFISTLRKINPNAQIILTTHAPSMVRGWVEHVKEVKQITVN